QVRLLAEWLEEAGTEHAVAREPGGTPLAEEIRKLLLEWRDGEIPDESELFLILAARASLVRAFVGPHLEAGRVVVADRYDLSTLAYQGYGRGLDLDAVRGANDLATGGLRPDLYLLLDVEVERGLERRRRDGDPEDRIEGAGADFLGRVRRGYLEIARYDDRVEVVEGDAPPERVQARLRSILRERFPETFGDRAV
ncbi:MAG TPA: dTMP kinase, partial [Longimicrobiales bacterium]|nr:dTMP kinase [Longimicrobiales bacterium]